MKLDYEEIDNLLNAYNAGNKYPETSEGFIEDCRRYIKAVEEHRMVCIIGKVAPSKMSCTLKFLEFEYVRSEKRGQVLNFYTLFEMLGYNPVKGESYFRIRGSNSDAAFDVNYRNIRKLHSLGFINKPKCKALANTLPCVL